MTSPIYEDDELCKKLTEEGVAICGDKFLQIDRLSQIPELHSLMQYNFLTPDPKSQILDLACGLGETALLWSKFDPSLKFTLNNLSQYQLSQCPDFPKVHSDALETNLEEESFDCVLLQYAIGHIPLKELLQETHRLLKLHGKMLIYDLLCTGPENNLNRLFYNEITLDKLVSISRVLGFRMTALKQVPRITSEWHEKLGLTKEFMKNTATFMLVLEKRYDS